MPAAETNSGWRRLSIMAAVVLAIIVGAARPATTLAEVDVSAPDPPNEVFVEQGTGWLPENHFDVWWYTPPGQQSPIAIAHYQLCPAVPLGPCTTHQAGGVDISQIEVTLPHAGWFWLRVWLEDGAGNVNPNEKSSEAMLRFDDGKPPEAFMRHSDAWLGETTPASPGYTVEIGAAAEWPMSGIKGYSITLDGTVPDDEVEVFAAQDYERFQASYVMQDLAEGVTTVRLRAVSNSGVPADVIGTTYLRLDRTPPVLSEDDLPIEDWYRDSLSIPLTAEDQEHLSGMAPALPERPLIEGAHIAYVLNGGATQRVGGGSGQVDVDTDGHHTLTYQAFDAAGNGSVEKEVGFKIDRTAPVGAFRALDVEDPRALRVDVEDVTSGIADGAIEYRREGEGGFRRLATSRAGGLLTARLDDEGLAPGRYEVRAVVTDVAGNEAVIDDWADGSSATLAMPLRLSANISVAGAVKVKGCAKAAKKRRGKDGRRKQGPRPKCRRKKAKLKAVTSLELKHGKRATSTGRLVAAQGAPIVAAPIVVEGQPRSGGPFVKVGVARTDAQGNFRFTVPAGPSRTIRYRYEGTNTVRPATAQLTTKVNAAARLKVDRRRLRNGQAVRFAGRLLGKPIPTAGKLVALQARVGREWRTFATPRANVKGVFRHRYRFTATTGLRRYEFRAIVAREAAYPYEKGVSRIVKVTVRGR
jgi:hypothetical protein